MFRYVKYTVRNALCILQKLHAINIQWNTCLAISTLLVLDYIDGNLKVHFILFSRLILTQVIEN